VKARLAIVLVAIVLVATPVFVSAVNRPSETLGVAEFNGVQGAAILVAPNNQSINLMVFDSTLVANANYTIHVLRNDVCGQQGVSLTGPLGPFAANNLGYLNVAVVAPLGGAIDQSGTQNIAVRIVNNGATVRCGLVYTNNPGGAGRHWW
jgi:hypothetical protein